MNSIATTSCQYGASTATEPAITNPTAIATSPPATTTLVPHRPANLADSGAAAPVKTAKGTVRTPLASVP